jgi:hypothetical protein
VAGLWDWCARRWRWLERQWDRYTSDLACFFAALALIFGLVAGVQRVQLHDRHLWVDWGTVPEWIAGIGSLIAFGALLVAVWEWRSGQVERRDREADQARLIIVEPVKPAADGVGSLVWYQNDEPAPYLVVCNHSTTPVFNLQVASLDENGEGTLVWLSRKVGGKMRYPRLVPVLRPNDATEELMVASGSMGLTGIEAITFTFTDAAGRDWSRTGTQQPTRLRRGQ